MSQAITLRAPARIGVLSQAAGALSRIAAAIGQSRAASRDPALSDLSDRQLRDIGLNRAAVTPSHPIIAVDAATMRTLMALR